MAKVRYNYKEKRTLTAEHFDLFARVWRDGAVYINNTYGTLGHNYDDTIYSNVDPAAVLAIKILTGFGTIYSMGPQRRDNG